MKPPFLALALLTILFLGLANSHATDGTWGGDSGAWNITTNWYNSTVANGSGAIANLNNDIGANTTITIDGTDDFTATVGTLNWNDPNGSHWRTIVGTNGGQLIFDNGGSAAHWNIGANNKSNWDSGLNISTVLNDDLIIDNQSNADIWMGYLQAGSAGLKTISNESTGTGIVRIGYNTLESGAVGSISDGAGILRIRQNSATSTLLLAANPSVDSSTYTGGLLWDKGNVIIYGRNAMGGADGVVEINAEDGILKKLSGAAAGLANKSIILNADITIDATDTGNPSKAWISFASDSVMTLTGDRELTILTNDGIDDSQSHIAIGGITDKDSEGVSQGYNFIKSGSGALKFQELLDITGNVIVNEGLLRSWGANAHLNADSSLIINGGGISISDWETLNTFTLNNGFTSGNGSFFAKEYLVSEGVIDTALGNRTGFTATLTKSGNETVTINKTAQYTGATTVEAGTLIVNGAFHNSSAVTVDAGGEFRYNSSTTRTGDITLNGTSEKRAILSGSGDLNIALALDNIGDTLSPGNSPGTQAFLTGQEWASFTYQWETNDFSGTTAGTDYDQISIDGMLTLTGGENAYALDLISLTADNDPGFVDNFSETDRSWTILTTTGGITGFNAANWTILTSQFTSDPGWEGFWSLGVSGNDLILSYSVIPEPHPLLLGLAALGLIACYRRFQKSKSA